MNFTNKSRKFFRHILFTLLSAILAVGLCQTPLARMVDLYSYDFLLKNVPSSSSISHEIAIIAIDDNSLKKIKAPLVLWQGYFASLMDALTKAGVKAILFDVIHAVSLKDFAPELDTKFMRAMQNSRKSGTKIYLGFKAGKIGGQMPHRNFMFLSSGLGFVNLYPDMDGKIRRQPFWFTDKKGRLAPALGLMVAMAHDQTKMDPKAYLCAQLSICDEASTPSFLNIDYRISPESLKVHSLHTVIKDSQQGQAEKLSKDFSGKVVLIGMKTDKLPDNHQVPFNPLDRSRKYAPGIAIQAMTALSILSGSYLKETSFNVKAWGTAVLAFVSSLFICFTAPFCWLLVLTAVFFAGAIIVIKAFSASVVIPTSFLFFGILVPIIATGSFVYMVHYRKTHSLKKYFSSYVNSKVMEEIIEHPENVHFEGDLVNFSIMFSDIRGFTTLSERLPAGHVVKGLNKYFAEMTQAIKSVDGYANRFVGDGILAFFGAPNRLPGNGAMAAVKGGLAMLERLEELNKKEIFPGCEEVKIGIGIHTGEAIVGNIGCFEKMDYTVIGDSANLASRIESLTKEYNASLLISESTYNSVKDGVVAEYVDCVKVKGRKNEVRIYKVHSIKVAEQ